MPSISCPDFLPISSFQNVFNYFSDNWLMVVDFTHVSRHYFVRVMDLPQFVSFSFQFYLIPDTCGGLQHWTESRGAGEAAGVPRDAPLGLPPGSLQPGLPRPELQQCEGPRDGHVEAPAARQVWDPEALLLQARLQSVRWRSVPARQCARPAPRHQAVLRAGAPHIPRHRAEHLLTLCRLPPLQQGPDLVLGALILICLHTVALV